MIYFLETTLNSVWHSSMDLPNIFVIIYVWAGRTLRTSRTSTLDIKFLEITSVSYPFLSSLLMTILDMSKAYKIGGWKDGWMDR